MRTLILSDIHSNLEALEAVMAGARAGGGFEAVWCLGDTVGYGPDPGPCLDLLQSHPLRMVAGNHDYAAAGKMGVEEFNAAAAAAALWTAGQLSPAHAAFLSGLPLVITQPPFSLVHGSLREPLWEYLVSTEAALGTLELLTTRFCLVGHSHIPFICRENGGSPQFVEFTQDRVFRLGNERWIINPGSVGQPRDRDPRSSYAIYDDQAGTVERRRVEYPIPVTQEKMRRAGLPQPLVLRLDHGV